MANEIVVTAVMSFSKGGKSDEVGTASQRITMTGGNFIRGTMNVTTAAAAIPLGAVSSPATPGMCWIKNNGSVAVNIRAGSGGANVVSIKAGEESLFRLATATPYAVTASSSADIEYEILED